jgi:hypothetical protein
VLEIDAFEGRPEAGLRRGQERGQELVGALAEQPVGDPEGDGVRGVFEGSRDLARSTRHLGGRAAEVHGARHLVGGRPLRPAQVMARANDMLAGE